MMALRKGRYEAATATSADEIAEALGTPRSSTYQLLQVLVDEGVVVHLPELRAYGLGVGVFEFGSAFLRQQPLENLARPLLSRLARRTEVTAVEEGLVRELRLERARTTTEDDDEDAG